MPNQTFNLIKNIVGCGVLALPNGVAAFASAPSGLIPASFLIMLMGIIFGYYFLLIGKTCRMTWALSFRDVWQETMGFESAFWVALCNMLKPGLANLAYSMILADTFRALFETVGLHLSRSVSLLIVTVTALLPLCLLKNLKVLAPFSIVGTLVFILVAVVMGIRYFDGTYNQEDGYFVDSLPDSFKPSFGSVGISGALSPNVLVLVCMLFEAYVAHYNAPRFYTELKDHTIPRFRTVVTYAFGASSIIYVVITCFGFLTFGTACNGNILNNYSTNDVLATVCRVSIAVAIICTYPVAFVGTRDGVLDVVALPPEKQTSNNLNVISIILLTIVTLIAMSVTDLGLINAVGGGTLATAIVFVFPTLMYRQAVKRKNFEEEQWDEEEGDEEEEDLPTPAQKREVLFSTVLMWMGIAMGAVGVYMAIANVHHTSSLNAVVAGNAT
jgi:amino acid permease